MSWNKRDNKLLSAFMYAALLVSLYLLTNNFLLFHAYAEGFSIAIAIVMFVITWNARHYIDNEYLHFIGLAYLFVAHIDFLHVMGYTGMNVFTNYDYHANQLWVLGRFMESLTLLIGFYFLHTQKRCNDLMVLVSYTLISVIGILSIFVWKIFPVAFVEGLGQTSFKIISEYIIIAILVLVLIGLKRYQEHFSPNLVKFIRLAVVMTIISEIFFTIYIDNYGISNIMGHYFKIISFYLIYKSIVEKGIREPYDVIFHRLESQRKELEKANQTKMKLFSIIGHDLRSPFNSLLGLLELMSKDPDAFSPEEQKKLFNELHKSTQETYHLVNGLLDWAMVNMEDIKLDMERINPVATINRVVNGFESMLDKKSLQVEISGDPQTVMLADEKSLEVIIRNLLSNSIKHSNPDGIITIRVLEINEEISIQVEDQGEGMTSEQAKKLLVSDINESTLGTANEKGTGLGFNIVKELVEKNQGKLKIESEKGKGTNIKLFFKRALK